MRTQKRPPNAARKPRNAAAGRLARRHAVPTTPGDKHMGGTEQQVSVTMPPKTDDDEPKQG